MHRISEILNNEEVENINQFKKAEIEAFEKTIQLRRDGKLGVKCIIRGMNEDNDYFELTPEETIRQLLLTQLIKKSKFSKKQIKLEENVSYYAGHQLITDKRIDISVYEKVTDTNPFMIIEVKRPSVTNAYHKYDGEAASPFDQLQSYCKQKNAKIGVIFNGGNLKKFYIHPFDEETSITIFPKAGQTYDEWYEGKRFTIKQLMQVDRLQHEVLKNIIIDVEQRFGANDSSDKAFDEIFKLIFTKMYDEKCSATDADIISVEMNRFHTALKDIDDSNFRQLEFRIKESESLDEIYEKINKLFQKAQSKWSGVFPEDSVLNMQKNTVKSCVKELQDVKLFNSNLEVIDDAFEQLVNKNQKEGMGQYFTPRYVIDMCVKMLNPKANETMIDTASGSCGFPMHTIFHVWKNLNPDAYNLFTTANRTEAELDYVKNNVFGIDFSEKSVRVGRMLNIIAGDGHTNVIELNTLDYPDWTKAYTSREEWQDKYNDGFKKLKKLSSNKNATADQERYKSFEFDILMANPPFSGKIDNPNQLEIYDLGHKDGNVDSRLQNSTTRDLLFIERNLNFLKSGGRMAIILPQGDFNNTTLRYVREYIAKQCRILAVVGLHENVFKPHTGTKTSVLIVQKWDAEKCPFKEDYPIFFATMQEPTKNNKGEKNYVQETYITDEKITYKSTAEYICKKDGHIITKDEYDNAMKKSDYRIHVKEENERETTTFIKDLFVDAGEAIELHKKWIQKNSRFELKNKKNSVDNLPDKLSISEYLELDPTKRLLYKETPIYGVNNKNTILDSQYQLLSKEEKKFYLPAENIYEYTENVKDTHGHIFVKHDLFNHDPNLQNQNPHNIYCQDGIAEAFIEFAKREELSFFQ